MNQGLIYKVSDKPAWSKTFIFALQQVLAILAATIAVPRIVENGMSQSAALFGAGVGTLVYLLFTKFKSPVFLGSSFAFLSSMAAAFAGGVSMSVGYMGLILGALIACLVYVIIALIVKASGTDWINKIMPPVVIGPTVSIIGLSLAGNAIRDALNGATFTSDGFAMNVKGWLSLICALVTLFVTIAASVYGKKMVKMIPFIIGIGSGYLVASIFTVIGLISKNTDLQIIDWSLFNNMKWYPDFSIVKMFGEYDFGEVGSFWVYLGTILVAYAPVALVVFAEHIADHKNLSSIIGEDLLKDPGLDKTLLGDGVGSLAGAIFSGCPNTTYGESIGCVAISKNASIRTIFLTAIIAIVISFVAPITTLLATIPTCVMGGVCITLYGFITVSGLKMIQEVDLGENKNLFVVSVILIAGVGGMALSIGKILLTEVAVALILGIVTNLLCNIKSKPEKVNESSSEEMKE